MSELDENRREQFINTIKDNQVIITCTDKIEIEKNNKKYYYIENGSVKEG